jgi:GNAT superfamily N-acetyltransferase
VDTDQINWLLGQQSPSERVIEASELQTLLDNPLFYLFVVQDHDRKYIGVATMFFQRSLTRWIAEIHDVVVDENFRGQGFGKQLTSKAMETALEFSVLHGVNIKLFLTSRPSRVAANKLYQKLGFVLVSKAHGPWGTNLYKRLVEPTGFRGLS